MTQVPTGLDFATLIRRLEDGSLPRDFTLHAARGFLPLPQDDLIAILAVLSANADSEIAGLARKTLGEIPVKTLVGFATNQRAEGKHLEELARAVEEDPLREAVLRNRSTFDRTVEHLARVVNAPLLQDIIVTNQERIIRAPEILDALFANPNLSPDVRRRALEVREEFFEKLERLKATRPDTPLLEEEASIEGIEDIADLLEKGLKLDEEAPEQAIATLPAVVNPDHLPAYNRILKMTVSEKIRCAYRGGKVERAILIRDRNKLVCTAVLRNGRANEQEIEGFAASRSVEDEVLRIIASSRIWMTKYPIMLAVTRNPKAPPGVVMPLLNRLTLKDLQILGKDRGVSEVVRKTATKIAATRTKKA